MGNDEVTRLIEENWNEFCRWCSQLGDRAAPIEKMLNDLGERAAIAPASSRVEFHNAFPGGLVDHSLRVLDYAVKLATALKVRVSKESLIIAALFHDWGKVGNLSGDLYLPESSDWHRDKLGQMYSNNHSIPFMHNAVRGLWLLSQYNVKLTEEEWLAILLNDGQYADENKGYGMKEPKLALLIHTADRWAASLEKGRRSITDPVQK